MKYLEVIIIKQVAYIKEIITDLNLNVFQKNYN